MRYIEENELWLQPLENVIRPELYEHLQEQGLIGLEEIYVKAPEGWGKRFIADNTKFEQPTKPKLEVIRGGKK